MNKNVKISAYIITKDEERNVGRALESIKWADEIIVVDGYSTDKTCAIARQYGAKVILSKYAGHDAEKNKAIKACRYDWVLEVDADEELTKGAETEIRKAILDNSYSGYTFLREEKFLGRVLVKGPKIRVYKNKFLYKGYTHEALQITGKIGKLKTVINHYNNQSVDEFLEYIESLSTKEVDRLIKEGKNISRIGLVWRIVYRNIYIFLLYYIYCGMIFKGFPGLAFTLLSCSHENAICIKYYERKYGPDSKKKNPA